MKKQYITPQMTITRVEIEPELLTQSFVSLFDEEAATENGTIPML